MTDIDAIRKKHEAQIAYTKEKQGDFPYLFQSIHSNLTISEVDALFKALDEARGKVEALTELVCECAPITWCRAHYMDDAIKWERKAEQILKGG